MHFSPYRAVLVVGLLLSLMACELPSRSVVEAHVERETQVFKWKMATTWPPNFPVIQESAERFAEQVRVMSGGRMHITVYAAGELIPALQVFDAVSQGSIEMGHGAAYYWAGKVPAAQFFTTVPFGMNARGMNSWLYHGGGLVLWQELYAPHRLIPMPMGNTGVQMGGWFNRPIESIEDLQGLKMRIPGLGGKVLAKAGGNPVLLAASEVFIALERNTIDAAEWIGPFHDERMGMQSAAQFYYYPGWQEPNAVLELIIHAPAWEKLPADLQAIIEQAARAENIFMHSEMEYRNMRALESLRKRSDIEIRAFPPEVIETLRALTLETLTEEAAQHPEFQRIFEAHQQFQAQDRAWAEISEQAAGIRATDP